MFAVFGVCKMHCEARAKKLTKPYRELEDGRRISLSESEWEQAKNEMAQELFKKAKAKKMSSIVTARIAAEDFKKLADKTGEARALSVRRRNQMMRNGSPVFHAKTKKPRYEWVAE